MGWSFPATCCCNAPCEEYMIDGQYDPAKINLNDPGDLGISDFENVDICCCDANFNITDIEAISNGLSSPDGHFFWELETLLNTCWAPYCSDPGGTPVEWQECTVFCCSIIDCPHKCWYKARIEVWCDLVTDLWTVGGWITFHRYGPNINASSYPCTGCNWSCEGACTTGCEGGVHTCTLTTPVFHLVPIGTTDLRVVNKQFSGTFWVDIVGMSPPARIKLVFSPSP